MQLIVKSYIVLLGSHHTFCRCSPQRVEQNEVKVKNVIITIPLIHGSYGSIDHAYRVVFAYTSAWYYYLFELVNAESNHFINNI